MGEVHATRRSTARLRVFDPRRDRWLPGDLLFQWGEGLVPSLISWGTALQYGFRPAPSHVAIVCDWPKPGQPVVVESTTLTREPCLVAGERVSGCQVHTLDEVLGRPGTTVRYRAVPVWRLDHAESLTLTRLLVEHFVREGRGYDYPGAVVSGTQLLRWLPDAALQTVFCSELVNAVLQRLGRMPVSNPARTSPASLLRRLLKAGVYREEPFGRAFDRAA